MNIDKYVIGKSISLEEMLDAREMRSYIQRELISKYKKPLISFTLNIAGPIKVFPLSIKTYEEGIDLIQCQCKANNINIIYKYEIKKPTGHECFFVIDNDPKKAKKVLTDLEEDSSLGRLFDIDIIKENGDKISRKDINIDERKCLLCDKAAFICSRSRAHSVEELLQRTCEIMIDYFAIKYAKEVSTIAVRSLLYEVLATPKPGLVDKNNTGSHSDMDIFTFESSALTLLPYFTQFVLLGINNAFIDPKELLYKGRPLGIQAEIAMLRSTNGINTHKGIIFSIGILLLALGYLYGNNTPYDRKAFKDIILKITSSIEGELTHIAKNTKTTHGESIYIKYNIKGARGEAISGFPTLFNIALPRFEDLFNKGYSQNDSGVLTLISIIANSQDTNIISRSSYEKMLRIQDICKDLLSNGIENKDYISIIKKLDEDFIKENISPGGSADILSLTYFVEFYERRFL